MEDTKKIFKYRLIVIFSLLVPLGLAIYFIIDLAHRFSSNEYILNIVCACIVLFFTFIEILLNIKSFKKDVFFYPIAFDEYYKINKIAVWALNAVQILGWVLFIVGLVFYTKTYEDYDKFSSSQILILVGVVIIVNCILYDIYLLFARQKKFSKEDLLK